MEKILIIRGWRSRKEHWQKTKEIFEKEGFEVLIPDLPGVSEGGKEIKEAWSINDYKNWVLKYAKNNGWEKFNLIGHSFGGAIAAKFAADFPEKVEKLILCAPAVAGTKSPRTILFYLTAQATKSIFLLPFLKDKFPKIKKELSSKGIKDYYFEGGVRKKILKKAAGENHKNNLIRIRKKTLILWGGKDEKISPKYVEEIKKIIPNSKIFIFPLANHSPHKEKPEEFTKEIIKFII